MKSRFVKRQDSSRLILIFAGWGMDWRPFAHLEHPGYDIMVIWDYRELTFKWGPLLRYDEICLIAWSMGVFAASVTVHEIEPRITMRIAVNGTLHPIDEQTGIPPAIWSGTLNMLSPGTWRKFKRRMCVSAEQFSAFSDNGPRRTIEELSEELVALETHTLFHVEQICDWDMAIVGRHDAIFPPGNQLRGWRDVAPVRMLDAGHLPDFQQLIRRLVKDKGYVGSRFRRAEASYGGSAVVQHRIARRLMGIFDSVFGSGPIVGNVIEVGPGADGVLTRMWYPRTDRRAKLRLWDLTEVDCREWAPAADFEVCDGEVRMKRQPTASAGFIFTSSTVQWMNSPREFLKECGRVLVPGGYLVLSSFVQGNFEELTSVTGTGLQLPTAEAWRTMVPAGLEVVVCEAGLERLWFGSRREVLEHLRDTGVNGVEFGRSAVVMARRLLREYPAGDDGRFCLTYRPLYLVAVKGGLAIN